jgi:hypothetical protein
VESWPEIGYPHFSWFFSVLLLESAAASFCTREFLLLLFTISTSICDSLFFLLHRKIADILSVVQTTRYGSAYKCTIWSSHICDELTYLSREKIWLYFSQHYFCCSVKGITKVLYLTFFMPLTHQASYSVSTGVLFPAANRLKLANHCVVPSLIMRGAIPPFLHTSSWCTKGQFCLFYIFALTSTFYNFLRSHQR